MAADIIILHLHMTTENHMTYGSWEMECNRQFFFAILGHFLSYVKIYSFKLTFLWTKPGF